MAGLLDFVQTPQGIGLLSAVAGGLAGARRGQPINSIGRGLVAGLTGYSTAQDQIKQEEENKIAQQLRQMQMEEIKQKLATQKANQAWKAGLPGVMAPKLVGTTEQGRTLAEQNNAFGQDGAQSLVDAAQYAQPDAPLGVQYGQDKQAIQDYLMQPESPYAEKLIEQQIMPSTEKPQLVTVYEDGQPVQKWIRPGETQGAVIGPGKPEAQQKPTKLDTIDIPRQDGSWQMFQTNPDGTPNMQAPIGAPFRKRATASEVNATAIGSKDVAKSLGGPVGDRAEQSLSIAEGAAETMTNANMVRDALNKGMVIAGPLVGVRMKWAQLKSLAGAGDMQELEDTRNTIQGLAALTLDSRASLKGQGQITEGETKLLERARSGNIEEMTVGELQSVVDISQRLAQRQWKKHQNLLGIMRTDPNAAASYQYYVPSTELPKPTARSSGEQKPKPAATFDLPPNAKQYDGKILRDTKSGKRFKSVGGKWQEVK